MMKSIFALALLPLASALEPLVVGTAGFQPVWQWALPNEIHINYDVPSYGTLSEVKAAKSSFLRGSADVVFSNDALATSGESSYASILSGLESALDQELAAIRASAVVSMKSGQSFLQLFPAREPQVNLMVDDVKGQLVDVARLRSDLYAYAKGKLDAIEAELMH